MTMEVCDTHNGDGWCYRCCPAEEAPAFWLELRGSREPVAQRPRRKNRMHPANAVESPYANRDTWYRRTA